MTSILKIEPKYSIVIPVYNEETTIRMVLERTLELLSDESLSYEIVLVDDGSQDKSLEILKSLQQEHPRIIRLVRHLYNKGYGSALRTGIRVARGETVMLMDADGQHDPTDIISLISLIPPYDLVIGYRTGEYKGELNRNIGNRFLNSFASWLANFEIKDLTSGFRAMRRNAVNHFLPLFPSGFSASATSTLAFLKAGYNVVYVPIDANPRGGGKSKVHFMKDGANFLNLILRMVMLFDPMRIFLPVSLILFLIGIAALFAGIAHAKRLIVSNSAIFLFIATLLVFLLGLLSSQLAAAQVHYHGDEEVLIVESGEADSQDK